MSKSKSKSVPPSIVITEDDLSINKGEIHKDMMNSISINSGAHTNKKNYTRKKKHKGKEE